MHADGKREDEGIRRQRKPKREEVLGSCREVRRGSGRPQAWSRARVGRVRDALLPAPPPPPPHRQPHLSPWLQPRTCCKQVTKARHAQGHRLRTTLKKHVLGSRHDSLNTHTEVPSAPDIPVKYLRICSYAWPLRHATDRQQCHVCPRGVPHVRHMGGGCRKWR